MSNSLLRLPEVERRTGMSRSQIYRLMQAKMFPRAVKISERRVGWVQEEIDNYVNAMIAARDRESAA